MAQTIGLRIGLEGENDFKSQLRDINQELRVCESQMRLTSASFDGNNDSIDALNARYSDLGTTSQAQRDKIELLRQALTNASESFGENDSRTRAWQIQLNNATTELTRTENEMRSTETALQGLNTAEQHAGDNAEELGRDLSTAANHTDELADGVRDVGNETENTGKSFTGFKEKLSDIGKKVGEFALTFLARSPPPLRWGDELPYP